MSDRLPAADGAAGPHPPSRRELKSALLWCARWFLPCGGFYRGPIRVRIEFLAEKDKLTVEPKGQITGIDEPECIRLTRPGLPATSEMVRHLLSDAERWIVRELAGHQPCQASEVLEAVKPRGVTRHDFWTIWAGLQSRRIVDQEDDGRFRVGPTWITELVSERG